jgi:hypothetical protein
MTLKDAIHLSIMTGESAQLFYFFMNKVIWFLVLLTIVVVTEIIPRQSGTTIG